MHLKDYVKSDQIIFINKNISKEEAISLLCKSISEAHSFDSEHIFEQVMDRENKMTTGIGGNVAVPHARLKGIDDFYIAVLINKTGINFNSLDGDPVNIITLLLSPCEKVKEHISLLSKISYFLTEDTTHKALMEATDVESIESLTVPF